MKLKWTEIEQTCSKILNGCGPQYFISLFKQVETFEIYTDVKRYNISGTVIRQISTVKELTEPYKVAGSTKGKDKHMQYTVYL